MRWLIGLILVFTLFTLNGCNDTDAHDTKDVLNQNWSQIEEEANGKEVHIFMWGGDEGINAYIDEYVAPELEERYSIKLERHPMDTADFISKLQTEKEANKNRGTMDIIWVNGENFRKAKERGLLLGDFASKLPNITQFIGLDQAFTQYDMGTNIEGHEAPWGKVQFVFIYDEAKVKQPPRNFEELEAWVKENPGNFTYPNVKDFTGNAFVRHLLYHHSNETSPLTEGFSEERLDENGDKVWNTLLDLKPFLWREGKTYPDTLAQLDKMFAAGEVSFTMGFNEKRVQSLIDDGVFPTTTKTFIMDSGSIGNTHYLSIPFNSPQPEAAITAINFMLSPEAQIQKMDQSMWGEGTVINQETLTKEQLDKIKTFGGNSTVPSSKILADLDTNYAEWIKEHWEHEVVQE